MPRKIRLHLLLATWIFMLIGHPLFAGEETDSTDNAVDPQVQKLVRQVADHMKSLRSFGVVTETTMTMDNAGVKTDMKVTHNIRAKRPNQLVVKIKTDGFSNSGALSLTSDGQALIAFVEDLYQYTVDAAPKSFRGFSDNPFLMTGVQDVPVIAALFSEDPFAIIMEGVVAAKYLGIEDLEGRRCHRMKFVEEGVDWEMWIEAGARPIIRKVLPDMTKPEKRSAAESNSGTTDLQMEVVTRLDKWSINPSFSEDTFAAVLPQDAQEVESFGRSADEGLHGLVGKMAPDFRLSALDGRWVDLAKHKNKDIVILDFWATWCLPCRDAMPIIDKVVDEYSEKGVVLYAVNVGEGKDEIQEFLDHLQLDVDVLLDLEGAVSYDYQVVGVPQTVLIGKDGSVQVVHVGMGPSLEDILKEDLDALLAGKNLAQEALAKEQENSR